MAQTRTTSVFRELLARPGIVRSMGAHDCFTARIVEREGFETVFIGGFGTSASRLGMPDLNLITMTEMADAVRRMAGCVSIPVVADGDTGHGDIANVMRTVREFESAGAAGILLEDQVAPKRCGHFAGKEVIPAEEMILKLKAALRARTDPDFVIIARTDAREPLGLEEAIDRANRYGDAGADCVFIEAPRSPEELEVIPRRVHHPLLVNMLTGGATPILPVHALEEMGYKIAVFPIESLLVTLHAVRMLARTLLQEGSLESIRGRMASFDEVKDLLGLQDYLTLRDTLSRR
ncbi:MAG: isocitrate lyase/PEP mutase family protein [Armatimonadota bacterium]